jgi:hypothetical protein
LAWGHGFLPDQKEKHFPNATTVVERLIGVSNSGTAGFLQGYKTWRVFEVPACPEKAPEKARALCLKMMIVVVCSMREEPEKSTEDNSVSS